MSSMTARQRDQACGAAALALRLDDWIHGRVELPRPKDIHMPHPSNSLRWIRDSLSHAIRMCPNLGEDQRLKAAARKRVLHEFQLAVASSHEVRNRHRQHCGRDAVSPLRDGAASSQSARAPLDGHEPAISRVPRAAHGSSAPSSRWVGWRLRLLRLRS